MKRTRLLLLILASLAVGTMYSQEQRPDTLVNLEAIEIVGHESQPEAFTVDKLNRMQLDVLPVKDVGTAMRNIPNVNGIRKGGAVLDPVVRGFKYSQLNVQLNNYSKEAADEAGLWIEEKLEAMDAGHNGFAIIPPDVPERQDDLDSTMFILLIAGSLSLALSTFLIINTINAAGDEGPKARPHILFWGAALAPVVGGLIMAGGLSAIQTAMVIGALPFSAVMASSGQTSAQAPHFSHSAGSNSGRTKPTTPRSAICGREQPLGHPDTEIRNL